MPRVTLADEISGRILTDFGAGDALPSERELAERYRCNRLTLRRALKDLNKSGKLVSVARNGHFIAEKTGMPVGVPPQSALRKRKPHILALTTRVVTPDHSYIAGGMIHYASLLGANITFKEIDTASDFSAFDSPRSFLPDIEVDGYIICGGVSFKLYEMLAKSMRPCVMTGLFKEQILEKAYDLRCLQFLLALEQPYNEAADRLISLGHRKILLASSVGDMETERIKNILQRRFADAGQGDDCVDSMFAKGRLPVPVSFAQNAAREIAARLTDHTAVMTICGGAFGCQLVQSLLNDRKLKCPEDISIVTQGSEADWYQELAGFDRICFERRELGGACVREIMRQLENGRLEHGIRYLPGAYIPGESTGPAKKNASA
jgi:DNA-binding transcriptional regulator YhcF (GntR family)